MPRRKRLPPLPADVWSPAGPIPVLRQKDLTADDGERCDGEWRPQERRIYIDASLTLAAAWPILQHEKVHAWLDDAGIFFTPKQHDLLELICNGLAQAMMAEMYEVMRRRG